MRRFTPLTNAFNQAAESRAHAIAIHSMFYNFARIHHTERATPAMAAGVTGKLWELDDIIAKIDEAASNPGKRVPRREPALAEGQGS
jgi:nicotinamide mononucleotide adenylyltransferase